MNNSSFISHIIEGVKPPVKPPAKVPSKALVFEKDHLRGPVPSRAFGSRDKVFASYLNTLNPRESADVQAALAASTDNRFLEFFERVMLPRYRMVSLATIAKACGISLLEFTNWWGKESTQKAVAIAQTHVPLITADMAKDAMSISVVCERCDGMGWVAAPSGLPLETPGYKPLNGENGEVRWTRTCPTCDGGGKNRRPGDAHARDRMLELSGLIVRGKAAVQVNLNMPVSHSSAVSDLSGMTIDVSAESQDE